MSSTDSIPTDVSKLKLRVSPRGWAEADSWTHHTRIARKVNEHMSGARGDAANSQTKSRSLADVYDLRLTALLIDLVEDHGGRGDLGRGFRRVGQRH